MRLDKIKLKFPPFPPKKKTLTCKIYYIIYVIFFLYTFLLYTNK